MFNRDIFGFVNQIALLGHYFGGGGKDTNKPSYSKQ